MVVNEVVNQGGQRRGQEGGALSYPAFLHLSGSHDDDTGVLLPRHLPEVIDCGIQTALAGNVCLRVLIWT